MLGNAGNDTLTGDGLTAVIMAGLGDDVVQGDDLGEIISADCGAPQRNNLEPSECALVLDELENWSEVLKAEPEVIHRLAAFADAASDDAGGHKSLPSMTDLPGLEP